MSENLNVLSAKVGEANRAVSTAMSNANVAMDAVQQTLYRQKHLADLVSRMQNRELENHELDMGAVLYELGVIAGRCPGIGSVESYLAEHHRLNAIVVQEFAELYEVVEKLRGLEAASVDPDGSATETP